MIEIAARHTHTIGPLLINCNLVSPEAIGPIAVVHVFEAEGRGVPAAVALHQVVQAGSRRHRHRHGNEDDLEWKTTS